MPGTRSAAWRTTCVAMLLALQLVVAGTPARAQEGVDTSPAAPTEPAPAEAEVEGTTPAEPLTTEVTVAQAAPDEAPVEPSPARSLLAPYALWGTSVVSLGLGTVFGVMALSAKKDYDDAPTYKRADKVHNLGIAADTGLSLGLLLAITGAVFYFKGHESSGGQHGQAADAHIRRHTRRTMLAELRIAPLVSHRAQGGTLTLRF